VAAGLLLVLVLPGAAILRVLLAEEGVEVLPRMAFVPALGIGASALAAVGLHAVGVRLERTAWLVALLALTTVGSLVCVLISRDATPKVWRPAIASRATLAWIALAGLLLAAAGAVTAASSRRAAQRDAFAQAWLVPSGAAALEVGIQNHEHNALNYTLELRKGTQMIRVWRSLVIARGQTWSTRLQSGPGRFELLLYPGKGGLLPAPSVAPLPGSGLHSEGVLAAAIHKHRACLASLPAADRLLLVLRFGVGGKPRQTEAQVGAQLHLPAAAVIAAELQAVRELEANSRPAGCRPSATTGSAVAKQQATHAKTPGGTSAPGSTTTSSAPLAAAPGGAGGSKPLVRLALSVPAPSR